MKLFLRVGEGYAPTNHTRKQYTIRYLSLLAALTSMCLYAVKQASAQQAEPAATAVADTTASVRDTLAIEEVEVNTGYQRIPKERATGSFVFVDSALLNRAVSTDIISRLKGVVPSLLFDERAGGEPKLSIRGRSTIFANADPLIVVDNFPYEGDIRNINPNDVESVSILRDAAAASIWGVRAGNGVIVITTKKGKAGQPLQVSFNGNVTVGEKPDLWYEPRISPADQIEVERFLFERGYYDRMLSNTTTYPLVPPAVSILANPSVSNNEKEQMLSDFKENDIRRDINNYLYRISAKQQYALGLRGGGNRHRYYFSAGIDRNLDAELGNDFSRLNLNAQQNFELSGRLDLEIGLFFTQHRQNIDHTITELLKPVGVATKAFSYVRLVDDNGLPIKHPRDLSETFVQNPPADGLHDWSYVPLDELNYGYHTKDVTNVRTNAGLSYRLATGFTAAVRFQYEIERIEDERLRPKETYYVRNLLNRFSSLTTIRGRTWNLPEGDVLDRSDGIMRSYHIRPQLAYNRNWQIHTVNVLAGFEAREMRNRNHPARYYGYDPANGTSLPVNLDSLYRQYPGGGAARIGDLQNSAVSGGIERFRSWYFNGAYTYDERIVASASMRVDQTNLFGVRTNQRSIPLWSAGLKWNLDKEHFFKESPLSRFALRTTFGYSGNFDATATAFVVANYAVNGYGMREAQLQGLPNPDLKGERNGVLNIGLDFEWHGGVLSGSIDYYRRKSTDLIGNMPIDATYGRSIFRGNVASMQGSGLDVTLSSRNMKGRISWDSQLFFSYIADKVVRYGAKGYSFVFSDASLTRSSEISPMIGRPLFAVYSYPWAGLDAENGTPIGYLNGEKSQNYIAIRSDYDNLVYHGRTTPSIFGALRNDFSVNRFSLSVNITYKLGYFLRRASATSSTVIANGAFSHPDFTKRWQKPGDELHTDVPAFSYPVNQNADNFYVNSAVLVERGDHIRLQDVRLAYAAPGQIFGKLGIHDIRLSLYASNLFIIWKANKHAIDPDYNANPRQGPVNMPAPRAISFSINASI